MEYNTTHNKLLNAQLNLLVEIMANQRVLKTILLSELSEFHNKDIKILEETFQEQFKDHCKEIHEAIFGEFGPDLKELLKDK